MISKRAGHGATYYVAIIGSIYLGLINATKLPSSDLVNYINWFLEAKHAPIESYLESHSREFLFFLIISILAKTQTLSEHGFVFILTTASYIILSISTIKLCNYLTFKNSQTIQLLFVILFLPPLFSLSAHLIRQFLAGSLVVFFLSYVLVTGKKNWLILLTAVGVHYSAIIFYITNFIKKIKGVSGPLSLLLCLLPMPILYLIAKYLSPLLKKVPVLGLVTERIASGAGHNLNQLSGFALVFTFFILIVSIHNVNHLFTKYRNSIWGLSFSTVLIATLCLWANYQTSLSEISTRFYFYLYFLLAPTLAIYFKANGHQFKSLSLFAFFVVPFFFYKLGHGEWIYAPLSKLLFLPVWMITSF